MRDDRKAPLVARRKLLQGGLAGASMGLLPFTSIRCTTAAPTRPTVIPAPVGGSDEPYPIPWLDKNGSHNQAGPGLEPSSIYHFKGRVARAAEFVGSGVDGAGNRLAFGSRTTDNSFMQGECWTSQRRAHRGAWTHL
jgi:hypothetical protein